MDNSGILIRMSSLDLDILHSIQSHMTPGVTWVMRLVTNIFLPEIILPIVAVILTVLIFKHKRLQEVLLLLMVLGNAMTLILKPIVHRMRPTSIQAVILDQQHSYSFPSGHAMAAMTVGGAIILLAHHKRRASPWLVTLVVVLILLAGVSRVYLGAHWPSDVLAGYVLGWLWLVFVWKGIRPWLERKWPAMLGDK